ncbi:MAG: ABC transporter permease [Lachnospiraceae bacterium]|nr:ABC transporter permease [Lachnospiraceae bacterium]
MKFRDVAIKNFKHNIRNYSAYFLCSCFTIMLFFMYTTLLFNDAVGSTESLDVLTYVFPITIVAIGVFSVFFINYAHRIFMKGRNKEFGIYMTLGMNQSDLKKQVLIESLIISIGSLVTGILVGLLFSRLFQMVILNLLDVDGIEFELSFRSFAYTILTYALIFGIVIWNTNRKLDKVDIGTLIQDARKKEGREYKRRDTVLGITGVIGMILSVIIVLVLAKDDRLNSNPLLLTGYMIISFASVYLVLAHGGNALIHRMKMSKGYLKNLFTINQIHYKFERNKNIIFILSVLSTMTIFLVASPFSLVNVTKSIVLMDPYHLEFTRGIGINAISDEDMEKIMSETMVEKKVMLPLLPAAEIREENTWNKPLISESSYRELCGKTLGLKEGEAVQLILDWTPGTHGMQKGETWNINVGNRNETVTLLSSGRFDWYISTMGSDGVLVVTDQTFDRLLQAGGGNAAYTFLAFQYKDWENSEDMVQRLKESIAENGTASVQYPIEASVLEYKDLKQGYSVFLFVTSVMGVLFFFASASVLYFRQYAEMGETKKVFAQLFRIGMTKKEAMKVITKELGIVCYLPLVFGSYMGISIIYLMTFIVGGGDVIKEFLQNALLMIGAYFLLQSITLVLTHTLYQKQLD